MCLVVFSLAVLLAWKHAIVAAEVAETASSTNFGSMSTDDQLQTDAKLRATISRINDFIGSMGPVMIQNGLEASVVDEIQNKGFKIIQDRRIALAAVPSGEVASAIEREALQAVRDEATRVMAAYGLDVVTYPILARSAGMPSCRSDCRCDHQSDKVSSSVKSPSSSVKSPSSSDM